MNKSDLFQEWKVGLVSEKSITIIYCINRIQDKIHTITLLDDVVTYGWEDCREMRMTANGVSFWGDEKFLILTVWWLYKSVNTLKSTELYTVGELYGMWTVSQ